MKDRKIIIETLKGTQKPLTIFRNINNITIDELAKATGLSPVMIYKIESGERYGSTMFWERYKELFKLSDEELNELLKLRQILPRRDV